MLGLASLIILFSIIFSRLFNFLRWAKRNNYQGVSLSVCVGSFLTLTGLFFGGITYATHNMMILWLAIGLFFASSNPLQGVSTGKAKNPERKYLNE